MKESEIRNREVFDTYLSLVEEDAKAFFNKREFITINCPACNSDNFSEQFKKAGFAYVLCSACGTLFVNPRPKPESIKDFYSNSPSSIFWVENFFKPVAEVRREKIFRPRAEYIKNRFPDLTNKVIADIGPGFGLLMEELKKICPQNRFIAIEPSLGMSDICKQKGFEVITALLEDLNDRYTDSFYLMTSFELFEHIVNPVVFLRQVYKFLQPGGYLLFTTLNGEGFDIQILWDKSKSIFPPHHLNFFNTTSIKTLLVSSGFMVKEISTPGKLDWDIAESMLKNENVKIGRFWELVAEKGTIEAKTDLQNWIQNNCFSSHMRIIAQKAEK